MAATATEKRLATLEARLDTLQQQVDAGLAPSLPDVAHGWKSIVGTFADDPLYDEAMRLGREWRENQFDEAEIP